MEFLNSKTKNIKFLDFVKKTKANIILYVPHPLLKTLNDEMQKVNEKGFPLKYAFYEPKCDTIFINPLVLEKFSGRELCRIVLHELGHWTGHKDRLNRSTINKKSEMIGTEEIVAESCFFYLSEYFNIDQKWALKIATNYIKLFSEAYPKLNSDMGYKEGLKASEYLLELTQTE
jgi:antirestriction protein ArdC